MRIAENIKAFEESPDSYDCINILVDGSPSNDLSMTGLKEQIDCVLSLGKKICIELFLDLHTETFSFYNELEFAIRKRSLEVLLEQIEGLTEENISHIIFYRGPLDFSNHIKRHAMTNMEYDKWKMELYENCMEEEHLLHLFSSQLLSSFFHSLGSILPDHIKGTLLLSTPLFLERAKTAELVSEETFSHLEIGIRNPSFFFEGIAWGKGNAFHSLSFTGESSEYTDDDVKTAVILPFLGLCNYQKFEEVCKRLEQRGIPYKIIEENLMNEKWFDIDHILFDVDRTSFDGKRMIDGFIAAGGKAYTFGDTGEERVNVHLEEGFLPAAKFFDFAQGETLV